MIQLVHNQRSFKGRNASITCQPWPGRQQLGFNSHQANCAGGFTMVSIHLQLILQIQRTRSKKSGWTFQKTTARWFKVTYWSPIWRSLNHLKGHLTIPKRSQRIASKKWCHKPSGLVCSHDLLFFRQQRLKSWWGPAVSVPCSQCFSACPLCFGYWWFFFSPTASQMYTIEMAPVCTSSFSRNCSSKFKLESSDNVGNLHAHKLNWLSFHSSIPTT